MNKLEKYSHQLKQYVKVKKRHPKMILFYRIDDFYELFSDDAVIVSKILNLTLTSRKGVQMCGVPVHNVSMHLKKMIDVGYKVATCERIEDHRFSDGFRYEITRIVRVETKVKTIPLNQKK